MFGRRVAARLRLTVSEDGVVVSAPQRTPMRVVHEFVLENWQWVKQQRDRLSARAKSLALAPGSLIRIYGVHRRLTIENRETGSTLDSIAEQRVSQVRDDGSLASKIRFELVDEILIAKVSDEVFRHLEMEPTRFGASYTRALARFAEAEARLHLAERVRHWSQVMGLHPSGISFRKQKTRWGSCSSDGHISLNWKLIFAPEAVIDYVVIHELAHLRHQNHSQQFWNLVLQFDPAAHSHRKWLRAHQHETKLFGK